MRPNSIWKRVLTISLTLCLLFTGINISGVSVAAVDSEDKIDATETLSIGETADSSSNEATDDIKKTLKFCIDKNFVKVYTSDTQGNGGASLKIKFFKYTSSDLSDTNVSCVSDYNVNYSTSNPISFYVECSENLPFVKAVYKDKTFDNNYFETKLDEGNTELNIYLKEIKNSSEEQEQEEVTGFYVNGATFVDYSKVLNTTNFYDVNKEYFLFRDNTEYGDLWNKCNHGKVYHGLATKSLETGFSLVDKKVFNNYELFPKQLDKRYMDDFKDNVAVEFVKTGDYYVLDSSKYNYRLQELNGNYVLKNTGKGTEDFFPFGNKNFHFGMVLPISFNISSNGMTGEKDTVFTFSGDDDVWIYIDGKLALDLGGVHDKVTGSINFNTGEIVTSPDARTNEKQFTSNVYTEMLGYSSVEEGKKALSTGIHSLKMYYLERGAGNSNCSISYNFSPITSENISIKKTDEDGNPLKGAEFGLFSDASCKTQIDYVTSNDEGIAAFKAIGAGTYYMKEMKAPEGYILNSEINSDESSDVYEITVTQETLKCTYVIKNNKGEIIGNSLARANIVNEKYVPSINLEKKATLLDWKERTYEIELSAYSLIKDIDDAYVKDYISNHFYVLDDNNEIITIERATSGVKLESGAVVQYDKERNLVYVEYENCNIPYAKDGRSKWSTSIKLMAKDTYLGGNDIKTNETGSGIFIKDQVFYFNFPKVNVRMSLSAGNESDVIFKGNEIGDSFTLMDAAKVAGIYNSDFSDVILSYEWRQGEGSVTSSNIEGYVKYISSLAPKTETIYELKVILSPTVSDNSPEAQAAAESMKNSDKLYTATMQYDDLQAKDEITAIGKYKVSVIDGTLTIKKQIKARDYAASQGDPIFTFKITKTRSVAGLALETVYYKTLRFSEVEKKENYVTLSCSITGLEAGDYKVEELDTIRFDLDEVTVLAETNCSSVMVDASSATFHIGTPIGSNTILEKDSSARFYGTYGAVTFTNKKNSDKGLTYTDVVKNTLKIGQTVESDEMVDNGKESTY